MDREEELIPYGFSGFLLIIIGYGFLLYFDWRVFVGVFCVRVGHNVFNKYTKLKKENELKSTFNKLVNG